MAEHIVDQLSKDRKYVIPEPARLLAVAWVKINEAVDHLPYYALLFAASDAGNQRSNFNQTLSLASVSFGARDQRTWRSGRDSCGQQLQKTIAIQIAEQAFRVCEFKMNWSCAEGRQLIKERQQPKANASRYRGTLGEVENDGPAGADMIRQAIAPQDVLKFLEG